MKLITVVARGFALFLGVFSLLNIIGEMLNHGFDVNLWWIDLRPLSEPLAQAFLGLASLSLIIYGSGYRAHWFRTLTLVLATAVWAVTIANTITYYRLRAGGELYACSPLPFSLILVAIFIIIIGSLFISQAPVLNRFGKVSVLGVVLLSLGSLPLAQIYCLGTTDYRRKADVIVVFGAKAYANGSLSAALADRVRTGCQLYKAGYAPVIIFSGGPGDGAIYEAEAMRNYAVKLGVPESAILLDLKGLNTNNTARNTCKICEELHFRRIIAVSHFYHLPRIKLAYQRQGREVLTVPAQMAGPRAEIPFMLVRETAALWSYYLQP